MQGIGRWVVRCQQALAMGAGLWLVAVAPVWAADSPPESLPLPLLPLAQFYRHPDLIDAKLSPSGNRLAVTINARGRIGLGVIELDGGGAAKLVSRFGNADITRFDWVNEERVVFSISDKQSGSGDQRFAPGLFAVDVRTGATRLLIRTQRDFVAERAGPGKPPLEWNFSLLAVPLASNLAEGGGNDVIVGQRAFDARGNLSAVVPMRLDTTTMRTVSLAEGMPDGATQWMFDRLGEPRLAAGVHQGMLAVSWRGPGKPAWRTLATMPAHHAAWLPDSLDGNGGLFVRVAEGPASTTTLRRFDFDTGQPAAGEPVVRTTGYDFDGQMIFDLQSGSLLGVSAQTDALTTVWFDKSLARWQADADKQLPGRTNALRCRRCADDDPVVLVQSWSDQFPGEFWLYRPKREAGQWTSIGKSRPDIDPQRMATLDLFRVKARDGLSIPVWLTQRPMPGQRSRRPAVVLVHGGPWVRGGTWAWHADAQFLASRGYVVVEPEFRGGLGFGQRHFEAGFKQWGQAMQDDVADVVKWAVAEGYVDADRVCIAGASYGGYAALMGPIRHPDLYRCAVAWVAVSEPLALFDQGTWSDIGDEAINYSLPDMLGHPQRDLPMLTEISAVVQAAKLKVPLLLAYGGADRRVPLAHGQHMRDALTAAGRPPQWVVYPEEGHGWLKEENRFDFAARMEAFLAEHLKPR